MRDRTAGKGSRRALATAFRPVLLLLALGASPFAEEGGRADQLESASRRALIEAAAGPALDKVEANLLIWRAGRGALAGAPAARNAERERERLSALAELEQRLDPASPQATAWLGYLGVLLQQEGRDELWCAAAKTAGEVGAYQWSRELVEELGPERPARRRVAARAALQRLYGAWFTDRESAEPYVDVVRPSQSARFLVAELRAANELAASRLLETLALRPDQAAQHLDHADPGVRRGAAEILGANVGLLDPATATESLLTHLDREAEPHAFHAMLQALLVHVQNRPPESPEMVRLRNTLVGVIDAGDDARALSVALALSRMSWAPGPGEHDVLQGVLSIGSVLGQLSEGEGLLEDDPDALVGTLEALQTACVRALDAGRGEDLRRSQARRPVLALLQDPRRADDIRIAAASAMGPLARTQDWRLLAGVLTQERASEALRHAVLGTFRSILPGFSPGTPEAHAVVEEIAEVSKAPEPDLRRRAYSLLREDRLNALVRAELDPRYLLDELARDQGPGLRSDVLDMIRQFGTPDMLDGLLALAAFDTLASAGPERLAELHAALRALSRDSGQRTMRAAQRLAAVSHPGTRVERLQRALNLVAGLDQSAVRELTPDDHRRVCAWAFWLHVAGLQPRTAVVDGRAFLERLQSLHLHLGRDAAEIPGFGAGAYAHLSAVTQAQLMTIEPVEGGEARVESLFEEAMRHVGDPEDEGFSMLVIRDRARVRARSKDEERRRQALNDFRALQGDPVLENSDLRQAVLLIGELGTDAQARIQRYHLLVELVERESWRSEPNAVRLQDLRELGAAALATGVVSHAGHVADMLAGLPDAPPENGVTNGATPHAWDGLERDETWLGELRALRSLCLGAATPSQEAEVAPAGEGAATETPPAEDPAETGAPGATGAPSGKGDAGNKDAGSTSSGGARSRR